MSSVLRSAGVLAIVIAGVAMAPVTASAQPAPATKNAPPAITFAKDIAPIFQKSCQGCHRPGQMAPMSLLTYQDVRPWARSIKQRVTERQMPPWGIDPHVGLQSFKNDPSLREDEIETIAKWVDAGAPMGNAADMPKPREWDDSDRWHIGKPDLIVTSPTHKVPAEAADWWGSYYVDTGLTEDRYIKAIESKPGKTAVVHHLLTYAVDADASGDSNGDDSSGDAGEFLNEFAVGKNGDLFPEGTGRLLRAGSKIKFDFHYHSVGQEITDRSQLGIVLYPKGYVAEAHRLLEAAGPADRAARHSRRIHLRPERRLHALQQGGAHHRVPAAHAHARQAAVHRADLSGQQDRADQLRRLELQLAPRQRLRRRCRADLSRRTVLHVITWHDNSASKGNPDPRNWVGSGNRTIDEMGFAWITLVRLHRRRVQGGVRRTQRREENHDHRGTTSMRGARGWRAGLGERW